MKLHARDAIQWRCCISEQRESADQTEISKGAVVQSGVCTDAPAMMAAWGIHM